MTKRKFLIGLQRKLSGLPRRDAEERISFYSEMIDDRIEDGYSEAAAVSDIGSLDEISAQIIKDAALSKATRKEAGTKRQWSAWEIILLVLCAPIWLSLAIAAVAVAISLYAVLWSVIISLWAVVISLAACALGGVVAGVFFAAYGNGAAGASTIGVGLVCAGLAILLFFGCAAATRGAILLSKNVVLSTVRLFIKKEEI